MTIDRSLLIIRYMLKRKLYDAKRARRSLLQEYSKHVTPKVACEIEDLNKSIENLKFQLEYLP